MTDGTLLKRIRAGDEHAFALLHRRYAGPLTRQAARITGDRASAEDIVQEAFIRAHRALLRDDNAIQLKPWLHRIVRNAALDELRGTRPEPTDTATLDQTVIATAARDPHTVVAGRLATAELLHDIAALPARQRDVLLRRELEGQSHEQVARDLGITPSASRALVVRARQTLVGHRALRDTACGEIRDELLAAHEARRRPKAQAHRHLRGCSECRLYRNRLRRVRSTLRGLLPAPWLIGAGFGGLSTTKLAIGTVSTAVVVGSGTLAVIHRAGEPSPYGVSDVALASPLTKGQAIPPRAALVTRTVHVGASRTATVSCPSGMVLAAVTPRPRTDTGWGLDPHTVIGTTGTAKLRFERGARDVPVGLLCKAPRADGSIRAVVAFAARVSARRKVCVRRAYLFETPDGGTVGSVYKGQPVKLLRTARKGRWSHIRTDAGILGWVRSGALCSRRGHAA